MSSVKSPEKRSARDFGEEHKIVVEKDEAEELLPGWTMEVKIRKTGSATNKVDRYYTDPVTGYVFNSLKDVQRYLKTGELGRLARKPKDDNTCLDKDNEDKMLHMEGYRKRSRSSERSKSELPRRASRRLAGINIDALIWLPSEPKTRQATRLAGIIIDSSSLSLPEPKKRQVTRQAAIKVDASASSPPEPKTHQATRQAGIKVDKSALSPPEPKTRLSKRQAGIEVDATASSPPEPKTRLAKQQVGIKVDSSTSSPLGPRTCQARIKVDASAASPPEPKTRQATRQAGVRVDASVLSSPEPKTCQARRLAGMETVASPQSLPEPKTRKATRLAGLEIDALPPSLPEPKARQARRLAGMESVALPPSLPPEGKTHQAAQPTGTPPSLPERKTRQGARPSGIRVGASPPEPRTTRQATARRVREAEARTTTFDLAPPKENDKKNKPGKSRFCEMQVECVKEITNKHDGNAGKPEYRKESSILVHPVNQESHDNKVNKLEVKADEKQELFIVSPPATPSIPKEHYKEIKTGSTPLPAASHTTATEEPPPPTVVPPVNLHVNQEPDVVNHPLSNPVPQESYGGRDMKPGSSMNFSMNDLWTDPCIDFAVKTLTGAIPCGDLNKANNFPPSLPSEVPLEELWTDPCIEFAVKTLTGAIPVGEDASPCVQDYLQHQPVSTSDPRSVHSFSLPDIGRNFCQTEVLSKHYETTHNKQHDLVAPTVGNGSLQVPGSSSSNNIGVHQGSNGQCSRPRLFQ